MPALQDSINAVRVAAEAADRIKATDIVAFDVADLLGITDIMMIAGASNERQVLAVAEEIEKDLFLKCSGRQPRSREGLTEGQWVLLDYGDFMSCTRNRANSTGSNDSGATARPSILNSHTRKRRSMRKMLPSPPRNVRIT